MYCERGIDIESQNKLKKFNREFECENELNTLSQKPAAAILRLLKLKAYHNTEACSSITCAH
jgi:hypothetical protein